MKKVIIIINIILVIAMVISGVYYNKLYKNPSDIYEIKNGDYTYSLSQSFLTKTKNSNPEKQINLTYDSSIIEDNTIVTKLSLCNDKLIVTHGNKASLYDLDLNLIKEYNFDGNIIKAFNNIILYQQGNQITVFDYEKETSNSFNFEVSSEPHINDVVIDDSNIYFAGYCTDKIDSQITNYPFSAGYTLSGEKLFENNETFVGKLYSIYLDEKEIIFSGVKGTVLENSFNSNYTPISFKLSEEKTEGLLNIYNKSDFSKENVLLSYNDYKYTMIHSVSKENGKLKLFCSVLKDGSSDFMSNQGLDTPPSKMLVCNIDQSNNKFSNVIVLPSSKTKDEIKQTSNGNYIVNIRLQNNSVISKEFNNSFIMKITLQLLIPLMNFFAAYKIWIISVLIVIDITTYFILKKKKSKI